eukprot:jgi/Botrbrau1/10426/Bobra.0133s0033.1
MGFAASPLLQQLNQFPLPQGHLAYLHWHASPLLRHLPSSSSSQLQSVGPSLVEVAPPPPAALPPGYDFDKEMQEVMARIKHVPTIYNHYGGGLKKFCKDHNVSVPTWESILKRKQTAGARRLLSTKDPAIEKKTSKVVKSKGQVSGRTYTSKYRGVHQTLPTKRWEAQFRRNGKPTSLGCFDEEEQAARAYDKMMIWCELHRAQGIKPGVPNFPSEDYEKDMAFLQSVNQEDLVQHLRQDGRRQAQQRTSKQKRDVHYLLSGAQMDDAIDGSC